MKKFILSIIIITSTFSIFSQDSLYIYKSDVSIIPYAIADIDSISLSTQDSLKINKSDASIIPFAIADVDSMSFKRIALTVTDIDGNVYNTITIGTQTWMLENLNVSQYNDGTPIPNVTDASSWASLSTGAYCYYNNSSSYETKHGKLYNWHAVNTGKLAPEGWHIPTDEEWTTLENYLIANGYNYDGTTTGNKIAKSLAAKTDWTTATWAGAVGNDLTQNNSAGFSGFPSGQRLDDEGVAKFSKMGDGGYFWTATTYDSSKAYYRYLYYSGSMVYRNYYSKWLGYSIRCIKD